MFCRLFHYRLVGIPSPDLGNEVILFHDPDYLFVVHDNLLFPFQPHFNLSPAVFGLALIKDFLDEQIVIAIFICLVSAF